MATILIVEDDEANYELMASVLASFGYQTRHAYDAQGGINILQQESIDLIVLDLRLPGMNGWEFAKQVRNASNIPIIVVSVQVKQDDETRAFQAGCDEYIPKPFDISHLRKVISHYLR